MSAELSTRHKILLRLAAVSFFLLGLWGNGFGFATKFGFKTHKIITQHALGAISHNEYADLHFFRNELEEGSMNEDSHDHQWRGNWDQWIKQLKEEYIAFKFTDAYTHLGFAVHLFQDEQVPAHQKYCYHGPAGYSYAGLPSIGRGLGRVDGLEDFAALHYGEIVGGNWGWDRRYEDLDGFSWKYWLSDAEDGDASAGEWGTYGHGDNAHPEKEPGNDAGRDWYNDNPLHAPVYSARPEIAHYQLYQARKQSEDHMMDIVKTLPPLIRFFNVTGKKVRRAGEWYVCVGPKKGSEITFKILENLSQVVRVDLRLQETHAGISTTGSDAGTWQAKKVRLKSGEQLPWEANFLLKWKGEAGGSKGKEGRYHLTVRVTDENDNTNPQHDLGYDSNKPIPVIIDTKSPRVDVAGFTNGAKYKKPVTVTAVMLDSYLDPASVNKWKAQGWTVTMKPRQTKDGAEYVRADLKKKFSGPGNYSIALDALDLAENVGKNKPGSFTIDVKKNDNPDDNEDTSSEPVVIQDEPSEPVVIGDDPLGPDEDAPEDVIMPPEAKPEPSPIGVLESGFSDEMGHLLGTINKPFDFVDPLAGTEEFYTHKVLIIPTDGLGIVQDNPFWRGKLELFCQQGGTVICYGQQIGKCYDLLPRQPKGFGWSEDQSCWFGSSYFVNPPHPMFTGQTDTMLDVYADGYFTTWPDDAQILIYRAKNNFPVAMAYPFGQGKVIATALYPDWGHENHQYSQEEALLFKNLIAWALDPNDSSLQTKPVPVAQNPGIPQDFLAWLTSPAEEVPKGTEVPFTFHLKNLSDKPKRFFAHYFMPHSGSVNEDPVYGHFKHLAPGGDAITSSLNKTLDVAPGATVEFTHTAPIIVDQDAFWVHLYEESVAEETHHSFGRAIYGMEPPPLELKFALNGKTYGAGDVVKASVQWDEGLWINDKRSWDAEMTLEILSPSGASLGKTQWNQIISSATLSVEKGIALPKALDDFTGYYQAHLSVTIRSEKIMDRCAYFQVLKPAVALDALVSSDSPQINMQLSSLEKTRSLPVRLIASFGVAGAAPTKTLDRQLTLSIGETVNEPLAFDTPLVDGVYVLAYAWEADGYRQNTAKQFSSKTVLDAHAIRDVEATKLDVQVKVINAGELHQKDLRLEVYSKELGTRRSEPFSLAPGQNQEITLTLPIDPEIQGGQYKIKVSLNNGMSQEAIWELQGPALTLDTPQKELQAGADLILNIRNSGERDTAFDAQLLLSGMGADIDMGKRSGNLQPKEEVQWSLPIPKDIVSGQYTFSFFASDAKRNESYRYSTQLHITAPQVQLDLLTDRDAYLPGQSAAITAALSASQDATIAGNLSLSLKNKSPDTPDTWEETPTQPHVQSIAAENGIVWFVQHFGTVGWYDSKNGEWHDYSEQALCLKGDTQQLIPLGSEVLAADINRYTQPKTVKLYLLDRSKDQWKSLALDSKVTDYLLKSDTRYAAKVGDEIWIPLRADWWLGNPVGDSIVQIGPDRANATAKSCSSADKPAGDRTSWDGDMPVGPDFVMQGDVVDQDIVWFVGQTSLYALHRADNQWEEYYAAPENSQIISFWKPYGGRLYVEEVQGPYYIKQALVTIDRPTKAVIERVDIPTHDTRRSVAGDNIWRLALGKLQRIDMRSGRLWEYFMQGRGTYLVGFTATTAGLWLDYYTPGPEFIGLDFLDQGTGLWQEYSEEKGNILSNQTPIIPAGDDAWAVSVHGPPRSGDPFNPYDPGHDTQLVHYDYRKALWEPVLRPTGIVGDLKTLYAFDEDIWFTSFIMPSRWISQKNKWEYFHTLNSGLPGGRVYDVLEDPQDSSRLWLGTNNGVASFNRKTGQWNRYLFKDVLKGLGVDATYPAAMQLQFVNNKLLCLAMQEAWPYDRWLVSYDTARNRWAIEDPKPPWDWRPFKIAADKKGLWILDEGGVTYMDGITGQARHWKNGQDGLGGNLSDMVVEDDNVWITHGRYWSDPADGVTRFDKKTQMWTHLRADGSNGLLSNEIAAMTRIESAMWFGTDEGLCRLDLKTGAWSSNKDLPWIRSMGEIKDGSGRFWVAGGSDIPLALLDADGRVLRRYDSKSDPKLPSGFVQIIRGQPWAGTSRLVAGEEHSKPVWEEKIPVSVGDIAVPPTPLSPTPGEGKVQIVRQTPPLSSPGRYDLIGEFRSARGQLLAEAMKVFYVTDGKFLLEFSADRSVYRPGEEIGISCSVANLTDADLINIPVSLKAGDQEIYNQLIALGPKGRFAFKASATKSSTFTAQLQAAQSVLRQEISVEAPAGEAEYLGPTVVGHDPFDAGVHISNTGKVLLEGTVKIGAEGGPESINTYSILPGESKDILKNFQTDKDMTVNVEIMGDLQQKYSRVLHMGEKGNITWNIPSRVLSGPMAIAFTIQNTGELPLKTMLQWELNGAQDQRSYEIPVGESFSDQIVTELAEGDYTLGWKMFDNTGEEHFHVVPNKEILELTIGKPSVDTGQLVVDGAISNTGGKDFTGEIIWDAGFFRESQAVEVKAGATWDAKWKAPLSNATPGAYTVKLSVTESGQTLKEISANVTLDSPTIVFSNAPKSFSGKPGEAKNLEFEVRNEGYLPARAVLECKIGDFYARSEGLWLEPGASQKATFAFGIPFEITPGSYKGVYSLAGKSNGDFDFSVAGEDLSVVATWDKKEYQVGEQATLTCIVTTNAADSRTLTAVVRRGEETWTRDFVSGGTACLEFPISVHAVDARLGFEKVLYSIYEKNGLSLYINRIDLPVTAGDLLHAITDKQEYLPGETVHFTISSAKPQEIALSAPGYEKNVTVQGEYADSFTLPKDMMQGTYSLDLRYDAGAKQSFFNVRGMMVKILEDQIQTAAAEGSKDLLFRVKVQSNKPVSALWHIEVEDCEGNLIVDKDIPTTLGEGTQILNETVTIPNAKGSRVVARHWLEDSTSGDMLAGGLKEVGLGGPTLLGVAMLKNQYSEGEPIEVQVDAFGFGTVPVRVEVANQTLWQGQMQFHSPARALATLPAMSAGTYDLSVILGDGETMTRQITVLPSASSAPNTPAVPTPPPSDSPNPSAAVTSPLNPASRAGLASQPVAIDHQPNVGPPFGQLPKSETGAEKEIWGAEEIAPAAALQQAAGTDLAIANARSKSRTKFHRLRRAKEARLVPLTRQRVAAGRQSWIEPNGLRAWTASAPSGAAGNDSPNRWRIAQLIFLGGLALGAGTLYRRARIARQKDRALSSPPASGASKENRFAGSP